MEPIQHHDHFIFFESKLAPLQTIINQNKYSKIFVLTDNNTGKICMPVFNSFMNEAIEFDIIETDSGEENKSISFCIDIWKTLLHFGADRKALIINLGGGVITDMGGFVASTYKRGIDFVNIPTTLLAQVDASVGGKTGIDIDNIKNMVGTFASPKGVFIETAFLQTLPKREALSGFAEMIKHGLIKDATYYQTLKLTDYQNISATAIYRSVEIKNQIVLADPTEKGLRKILNFGHTIGHALESYSLNCDRKPLTHGQAIAIGMLCEAWLSVKNCYLSEAELQNISNCILNIYPKYNIKQTSHSTLISLMLSDKKNEGGSICFSLLNKIGNCTYNCCLTDADIFESFKYYNSL